jgi:hypothetical protein
MDHDSPWVCYSCIHYHNNEGDKYCLSCTEFDDKLPSLFSYNQRGIDTCDEDDIFYDQEDIFFEETDIEMKLFYDVFLQNEISVTRFDLSNLKRYFV